MISGLHLQAKFFFITSSVAFLAIDLESFEKIEICSNQTNEFNPTSNPLFQISRQTQFETCFPIKRAQNLKSRKLERSRKGWNFHRKKVQR